MSPTSTAPTAAHVADLVVFGGTGDLSMRKLLPALYHSDVEGRLAPETRIIAMSRGGLTDEDFRGKVDAEVRDQVPADPGAWQRFLGRLHHVSVDVGGENRSGWSALSVLLGGHEQRDRVFYLASPPMTFGPFCRDLERAGLVTPRSRVVLEKPLGRDLASAQRINEEVGAIFDEAQIFRIDHYLGKETVQNLLVLRFANAFLEPIWNSLWIDHVQITAAETIGVEGRGRFYDPTGCLRDMVPNHLFQLLAMIAMEPPAAFTTEAMQRRRAEVIEAVRPLQPGDVVRGQYAAGAINRVVVPGYREEDTVPEDSNTETYVAMKLQVDTWRWAGVPFYLRTGKRLRERTTEIAIRFKPAPLAPFRSTEVGGYGPDWLVLHIQPDEGISLQFDVKRPGPQVALAPVRMDFRYRDWFPKEYSVGYEQLLRDCMNGESGLFQDAAMVEGAWRIVQPILDAWKEAPNDFPNYAAGSAGPAAADALLALNGGHAWRALTAGRRPPPRRAAEERPAPAARKSAKPPAKKTAARKAAPKKRASKAAARKPRR